MSALSVHDEHRELFTSYANERKVDPVPTGNAHHDNRPSAT